MESPYNPRAAYQTWSLKGKILPWEIGNGGGIASFLGVEYGFLKHNSIGVDGFLHLMESSDDDVRDTAGLKHDVGNYWTGVERAILFDYRYYFDNIERRYSGVAFYLLTYVRLGAISRHYDPLYRADYLDHWETHHSAGLSFGATIPIDKRYRWGIDINAGVFEKEKRIVETYLDKAAMTKRSVGPGFRLSVNFSYWFKRGGKT